MTRYILYYGEALPLSENISLYDLLICVASKTAPLDKEYMNIYSYYQEVFRNYCNCNYNQEVDVEKELENARECIYNYFMEGKLIAYGKEAKFKVNNINPRGIYKEFSSQDHLLNISIEVKRVNISHWSYFSILWNYSTLIAEDCTETQPQSGDCYTEIFVKTDQALDLFPKLLTNEFTPVESGIREQRKTELGFLMSSI